jgi:hypothetical protein
MNVAMSQIYVKLASLEAQAWTASRYRALGVYR